MSSVLDKPSSAGQQMKANQIMLIGRLDHVSRFEGKVDHIMTLPAADEYSKL